VEEKDIGMIREELGPLGGGMFLPGVRIVQSCPGNAYCKNGTQDSLSLASALSNRYTEIKLPAKLKIGISGCPRCCGQSKVRDIGIVGSNNGWTVFFGGNSGYRCREGDTVVSGIQTGRTMELVDRLMTWYQSEAKEKERTARFMERVESDEALKNEFSRIRGEFEIPGCGTT
jgi:NAD(P)H-nitrite reductase large subunit